MNHINNYKKWIDSEIINEESKIELLTIQNDEAEIYSDSLESYTF